MRIVRILPSRAYFQKVDAEIPTCSQNDLTRYARIAAAGCVSVFSDMRQISKLRDLARMPRAVVFNFPSPIVPEADWTLVACATKPTTAIFG
jgi:hypothetical protein